MRRLADQVHLRAPRADELGALSGLCLRSKAYWGYDDVFISACRDELSMRPEDIASDTVIVAEIDGRAVGVAQVSVEGNAAWLVKLFVDTDAMGLGVGSRLFRRSVDAARQRGATQLVIEADPGAVPFYERMGALRDGDAPSGSIPGRRLPRLVTRL